MNSWTRDGSGAFVDWTQPPYRQDAILRLVLTGEDPSTLSLATRIKRIREYYKLVKRERRGAE